MPFGDPTQRLQLGMTQREVEKVLGEKYKIVASRYSPEGQPMTVWEYQDSKEDPVYWIFLKNGKLVQWGTPATIRALPDVQSMSLPAN